tara:strand:+ start:1717 stop:1839 length:123 start_codon:yes stop_codon:yes gene_type:complete
MVLSEFNLTLCKYDLFAEGFSFVECDFPLFFPQEEFHLQQ